MKIKPILASIAVLGCISTAGFCAEEFTCEVMSVQGAAYLKNDQVSSQPLKEKDILKSGDWVEVASRSYVDLAYDRDWNNVTRIEENSKVQIRSVCPGSLSLANGSVFAKLKSLPRDTSFEVQTPTAVAAVRGTEFRAAYGDNGSEILNFSDSNVYVYGLDESGSISKTHEPLILKNSEKTQVLRRGEFHFEPHRMNSADEVHGKGIQEHMERRIHELNAVGRVGRIQDLKSTNAFISDKIQRGEFQRPEERFHGLRPRLDANDRKPSETHDLAQRPNATRPGGQREKFMEGPPRQDRDPAPRRERQGVNRPSMKNSESDHRPQTQKRAAPPPRPRPRQ